MKAKGTRTPFTPLALEAWIMLLCLGLGLGLLLLIHGRTQALETAAREQQSLALALMDAAEAFKADPLALGDPAQGPLTQTLTYGELTLTARISRENAPGGVLYTLELTGQSPGGKTASLKTARYFPGEVTP